MSKRTVDMLRRRLEARGIICGLDQRLIDIHTEAPDLAPDKVRQLLADIPTSIIDQAFHKR